MRERTPSADDTPKRAPPAPAREASAEDVAGSKTTNCPVESPSPSPESGVSSASSSSSSSVERMVASTHTLEDLGVSHPASASGDRQQQQQQQQPQEKHGHAYRPGQSAQDKRSRLSNVINNLRKKVPESKCADSPRKEEDERNSVERNLETLEKYVMTVLNGVIKDEEEEEEDDDDDDDDDGGDENGSSTMKEEDEVSERSSESTGKTIDQEDEDSKGPTARFEPSKPNESRSEVAILVDQDLESSRDAISKDSKGSSKDASEAHFEGLDDKRENRSLGAIIMDRLNDHQEDRLSEKTDPSEVNPETIELRNICRDLLNDLLTGINQLIDDKTPDTQDELPETRLSQELPKTSLHCSLPLDKVASVLQNCQSSETVSPTSSNQVILSKSPKPPSPTVRHLCLYCDRKFLSISLRQRHTERVHQLGGGRRSERNSRKPSQNCQYCSDKCAESLEGLFQHMAGNHGDKYYACVQCSTRYPNRETLASHMSENHSNVTVQIVEKAKEVVVVSKESNSQREKLEGLASRERRDESNQEEYRAEISLLKPLIAKETISNPGSPEFDSSFYSSVSCNIRENLLHHLDGKLQATTSSTPNSSGESKPPVQQPPNFYEPNQIQFPIDISLTAATPVYTKEYGASEEYENSSEYAQKPGKSRSHPRRVSFEKYNFPRKYEGREQWTCSIKDLSKFDISTQLTLRKKQQLLKDRTVANRQNVHLDNLVDHPQTNLEKQSNSVDDVAEEAVVAAVDTEREDQSQRELVNSILKAETFEEPTQEASTEFTSEFGSFLRLRKWDESSNEAAKAQEVVYAELTGEWSRPRIYICGACTSKHVTLREMEEHKAISHPNVWCSHFEFSGDQRELYKHLFLPGRSLATAKARNAVLMEKVCTKCTKGCNSLAELHRHMLECGGDQAWLLGLFGNGKKKCKWRPFGSRSRRRRQRGMKRNIQNSQTPRSNVPREKQPAGPRIRPSDRESIQKMLANLPPKRATRKVLQESTLRAQGRLRNVQTRSRPRIIDNSSASRLSRNKAALRNKLLKNAKSFQRNRCRSDNISAAIESVVKKCHNVEESQKVEGVEDGEDKETKERGEAVRSSQSEWTSVKARGIRGAKRRSVKGSVSTGNSPEQPRGRERIIGFKAKNKSSLKNASSLKIEDEEDSKRAAKTSMKEKEDDRKSPGVKQRSPSQSSLRRRRTVDPVASLNASLKAKSQLRTQDGKFARNPNKDASPSQKSPGIRPPGSRPVGRPSKNSEGRDSFGARPKLRVVPRSKSSDSITPKRTTRLSSDSDKMPTLEPAVQNLSDEYPESAPHDLPILSPVTSCADQKTRAALKNAAASSADQEALSNSRRSLHDKERSENSESKTRPPERGNVEKIQKPGRGRPRNDARLALRKELQSKASKEEVRTPKPRGRKSLASKLANSAETSKEDSKSKDSQADASQKEENVVKQDARVSLKGKEKEVDVEEEIKIDSVPFEVKKLIGSASKEDLLTKLNLSRDGTTKRSLRQSIPRLNLSSGRGRPPKDQDSEKEFGVLDGLRRRRQSLDVRRKSPRTLEKKEVPETEEEATPAREVVGLKIGTRSRRSCSLSTEAKSNSLDGLESPESITSKENQSKESSEKESTKRQTRASLQGLDDAVQNQEATETIDTSSKRGRRRDGRRSIATDRVIQNEEETKEAQPIEKATSPTVKTLDNQPEETSEDNSQKNPKEDESSVPESTETDEPEQSKAETAHPEPANSNVNQLQLETSNSLDSGKENSLESSAPPQKQRVGRPRKSWGAKRERTSKRSLNNVIGILTEGMNIPAETQQSVVLTVQTTIDHVNQTTMDHVNLEGLQCNPRQPEDDTNPTKTLETDDKSVNEEPIETKLEEDNANPPEKETIESPQKNKEVAQEKTASPASDIILDLSRRRPSGKGSFLERIVSKIAKQKDVLLEGEVGSLLDTAADELSSILDEVVPTDHGETHLNDSKNEVKLDNCTSEVRHQEIELGIVSVTPSLSKSGDLTIPSVELSVRKDLKNSEKEIVEPILTTDTKESDKSINHEEQMNVLLETEEKLSKVVNVEEEKQISLEETSIVDETPSVANGNCLPVTDEVMNPAQVSSSEKSDDSEQSKKKSKKRTLETNSPKKSKRKSVEVEEEIFGEEVNLADIMSLIQKSSQDNKSNSAGETEVEKVLSGKRKSLSDLQQENGFTDEVNDPKSEVDDSKSETINLDYTKKLKVQTDKDRSDSSEEISKEIGNSRSPSTILRTGKRKSYSEIAEEYSDTEATYKRFSKRRSLPENAVAAGKEVVKSDNESETLDTSFQPPTSKNDELMTTEAIETAVDYSNATPSLQQTFPIPQKTILRVPEISRLFENSSSFHKSEPQETLAVPQSKSGINSSNEPKNVVDIVVPKVPKKRGRKKKSQANGETPSNTLTSQSESIDLESQDNLPKKSMRLNPLVELDTPTKRSSNSSPSNLEHFKVPEVTEVLQHTRKRSSKRKSLVEETNEESVIPEKEINGSSESKPVLDEQITDSSEKLSQDTPILDSKVSEELKSLEKPVSGFVDLVVPTATCKTLSSDDAPESLTSDANNESMDSLSETSCASESSHSRRKRLSKKKKSLEETVDSRDSSIIDSESAETEKSLERRQSLTRKAKKNISFSYDDSDLVYDFEGRVELPSFAKELNLDEAKEIEPKVLSTEEKTVSDEKSSEKETQDSKTDVPENESNDLKESLTSEVSSTDVDDGQPKEDFQTPKKRGAGNFVVVHTKTGEILIVEKRKKLTKEAARFFCDVCATSFTRKSSLKKHNLSQSHLLQLTKSSKEKVSSISNGKSLEDDDIKDCWKSSEPSITDISLEEENSSNPEKATPPLADFTSESLETKSNPDDNDCDLQDQSLSLDSPNPYNQFPIQSNSMMDNRAAEQESLEDELLDEEICKITENMSHDEYVLTDHVSPLQPELTSTPVKALVLDIEGPEKKKVEKEKEKGKKKNLAEEHLALDTPEPEIEVLPEIPKVIQALEIPKFEVHLSNSPKVEKTCDEVVNEVSLPEGIKESKETLESERGEKERKRCLEVEVSENPSPAKLKKDQSPKEMLEEAPMREEDRASLKITISKKNLDSIYGFEINPVKPIDIQLSGNNLTETVQAKETAGLPEDVSFNTVMDISNSESQEEQEPKEASTTEEIQRESTINNSEVDQSKPSKAKKGKSKKHSSQARSESNLDAEPRKSGKSRRSQNKRQVFEQPISEIEDEYSPTSEEQPIISSEEKQGISEESLAKADARDSERIDESSPAELQTNKTETSSTHENSVDESLSRLHEETKDAEEVAESTRSKESLLSIDEDEASSNSSFADKPLAEFLSHIEEKLDNSDHEDKKLPTASLDKLEDKEDQEQNSTLEADINQDLNKDESLTPEEKPSPTEEESAVENVQEKSSKEEMTPCDSEISENESFQASFASVDKDEPPKLLINIPEEKDFNEKEESTEASTRKSTTIDRQSSSKKSSKVHKGKESKKKPKAAKKSRKSSKSKFLNLTSESEDSDSGDKNDSQNKSKIVKSVFGRVFGGEKTDKVKEVLNDWVSKSEDDSEASRLSLESSDRKGNRQRKSKSKEIDVQQDSKEIRTSESTRNRKKQDSSINNHLPTSLELEDAPPTSRCRQSKKRAEERISREIYFESLISTDTLDLEKADCDFHLEEEAKISKLILDEASSDNETGKSSRRRKSSGSRKARKKPSEENWEGLSREEQPLKSLANGTTKKQEVTSSPSRQEIKLSEEKTLEDKKSKAASNIDLESNSSSSLGLSTPRNRSPSPDRNSQSNSEAEEVEENLEERRMSPLFARSTPDSSIESSSTSENEEEEPAEEKRSCSAFSGEKVVIRSPSSSHKSEVVTIAPTDAIEDNALDVPQEIEASKPRQGKILNFDEELFVECCSRLKATTENELRGAKKIKLDHSEGYHRKEEQEQGFKLSKDRWRDVESQNSLGSLLESVNQLLGEEMYTKERSRNARSEQSSRSGSPDISRSENLGYEDSLDVAFEHNNKLRDKIQQRMRESENLIASSFGQKTNNHGGQRSHRKLESAPALRNPYDHVRGQGYHPNGEYDEAGRARVNQHQGNKIHVQASGFKSEMNSALGGLLDKALSNLLHSNGKHDQNGSTPMKVLAELACAQAPTSTSSVDGEHQEQPAQVSTVKSAFEKEPQDSEKEQQVKKPRNPIKELFERKKINEKKQERSKNDAALRELNAQKQRKVKKKKNQEFPLIRCGEHGGMVERKKRRDERKDEACDRIKDVYEFDEEESQTEPTLGPVLSYRSRTDKSYEVSCVRTKDLDVAGLMSKAIGDSLENGKISDALGTRLESMIDKKFKELEKFAPKTKGALKSFQGEDQSRPVTGPMDEFVERKQQKSKRSSDQSLKQSKLKKRNKNSKKKARNSWYENDSSDEYRSMAKTEEVGVGITKSQRACSRGKQNLFAELSTSSESEVEDDEDEFDAKDERVKSTAQKEVVDANEEDQERDSVKFDISNENHLNDWEDLDLKNGDKNDLDNKKSESELSDHPLIIDERKDTDEQRNSDEETENQYDRGFELDDLYREDSSVADSDAEEPTNQPPLDNTNNLATPQDKPDILPEDELIPLEEALDLLDPPENLLSNQFTSENQDSEQVNVSRPTLHEANQTSNNIEELDEKSPAEEQEEEVDDDVPALPEKLSGNEKPQKESENLPLHVFLSRKVQESKKRKEQQLKKLQEEQERILLDFQPTRRQRKCAIGKQGLLAEISSSDEETYIRDSRRFSEKSDHDKSRKPKRESKEKRKERYIEKKHEQMIAKEQKAIEEEILRELGKKKENVSPTSEVKENLDHSNEQSALDQMSDDKSDHIQNPKKKHPPKEKKKIVKSVDSSVKSDDAFSDIENNCEDAKSTESLLDNETNSDSSSKQKKHSKSPSKSRKPSRVDVKTPVSAKKSKTPVDRRPKDNKERRSSNGKRDSDDEELKTTKSWNKVEEGVGVAIGRRKRAAANQLYYWSSSSDEEEPIEVAPVVEEEEDDRQEQHGWIVGDSHKRMITMLAMEKQLKEKRRRSEDEFELSKGKSKKHRNSTS